MVAPTLVSCSCPCCVEPLCRLTCFVFVCRVSQCLYHILGHTVRSLLHCDGLVDVRTKHLATCICCDSLIGAYYSRGRDACAISAPCMFHSCYSKVHIVVRCDWCALFATMAYSLKSSLFWIIHARSNIAVHTVSSQVACISGNTIHCNRRIC